MTFSERFGIVTPEAVKKLGAEAVTPAVRTGIWNVFLSRLFSKVTISRDGMVSQDYYIFISLWKNFYKLPLDDFEREVSERKAWYRDQVEVQPFEKLFDLLEFIAARLTISESATFCADVNAVFEAEKCPFRFVGDKLAAIRSNAAADKLTFVLRAGKEWALEDVVASVGAALAKLDARGAVDVAQAFREFGEFLNVLHTRFGNGAQVAAFMAAARAPVEKLLTLGALSPETINFVAATLGHYGFTLLELAVQDGALSPIDLSQYKESLPDPWGERQSKTPKV